jgi:26S proteasome regulatory subunit T5
LRVPRRALAPPADAAARARARRAADDIVRRTRLLDNEIRVLKDENARLGLEQNGNKEKVKDNLDKIKLNRQLPYLVGNVVEVLDQVPEARARGRAARATCSRQP